MPPRRCGRRLLACLLASVLLHLLAVLAGELHAPRARQEPATFRVHRRAFVPPRVERLRVGPVAPLPHATLERLREEAAAPRAWQGSPWNRLEPGADRALADSSARLPVGGTEGSPGERDTWEGRGDTMPGVAPVRPEALRRLPLASDPLELDALAREHTVVLVDPETGKLRRAWLHLPAYENSPPTLREPPWGCGRYEGTKGLLEAADLAARGFRLPGAVPIEWHVRLHELGCLVHGLSHIDGFPDPDPIHSFALYPRRHILHRTEMAQYPVIDLHYIDVESTEVAGQYLLDGGFFIAGYGQMGLLERELRRRTAPGDGERVTRVTMGLEHPLFHSFFDITALCCTRECGGSRRRVCAVPGLQLDGRLVAAITPPFDPKRDCPANKLHVNVLAWALVQPSPMGGRYLAGSRGAVAREVR
ncbi:MAG: hypothetical protein AB1505_05460 [Candidatus Latescibacterota bacterium]